MMTQTDPPHPRSSGHGQDDLRDRATEVAHDAAGEARSVAGTAQDEAKRVTDEIRDQAASLTASARQQLHDQARTQTDHLGEAIGGMGDRIQALADGRPEDAGNAQQVVESIAGQITDMSGRIEDLGFDGAVDELQRYARRRPGAFLAGAAVLGFAAARLTQGVRSADDNGSAAEPAARSAGQQPHGQQPRGDDSTLPPSRPLGLDRPPLEDGGPIVIPEAANQRTRR